MTIKLLLLTSLFFLCYSVFIGEYPEPGRLRDFIKSKAMSFVGMLLFFFIGKIVFMSNLNGLIFAPLGWCIPVWIVAHKKMQQKSKLQELAMNFITGAAGSYGSGQATIGVIQHAAMRMPEPFATDFKDILGLVRLNRYTTIPHEIRKLGQNYNLKELDAVAGIMEASERAGGPAGAARSLRRLIKTLKDLARQTAERQKSNMEPQVACFIAMAGLAVGLIFDITVFRDMFKEAKLILSVGCLVFVALVFASVKMSSNRDLEEV